MRWGIAVAAFIPSIAWAEPFVTAGAVSARDVHVRLDTDVTWGIGSQMYLGGWLHGEAQIPAWATRAATGTFDLGLRVAYGHEGMYFAPWINRDEFRGAGHRVAAQVVVGPTFHLTPQRRVGLGVHALVGWNVLVNEGTLTYAQEDFTVSAVWARHRFIASGDVTLTYRASPRVGVNLAVTAPFPTSSSYVIGLVSVGVGASFYLR